MGSSRCNIPVLNHRSLLWVGAADQCMLRTSPRTSATLATAWDGKSIVPFAEQLIPELSTPCVAGKNGRRNSLLLDRCCNDRLNVTNPGSCTATQSNSQRLCHCYIPKLPTSEYQALLSLFSSLNGPSWLGLAGSGWDWLAGDPVCIVGWSLIVVVYSCCLRARVSGATCDRSATTAGLV